MGGLDDWAQPGGEGLAGARCGVHQPTLAGEIGLPHFALEWEGRPSARGEPRVDAIGNQDGRTIQPRRWTCA